MKRFLNFLEFCAAAATIAGTLIILEILLAFLEGRI